MDNKQLTTSDAQLFFEQHQGSSVEEMAASIEQLPKNQAKRIADSFTEQTSKLTLDLTSDLMKLVAVLAQIQGIALVGNHEQLAAITEEFRSKLVNAIDKLDVSHQRIKLFTLGLPLIDQPAIQVIVSKYRQAIIEGQNSGRFDQLIEITQRNEDDIDILISQVKHAGRPADSSLETLAEWAVKIYAIEKTWKRTAQALYREIKDTPGLHPDQESWLNWFEGKKPKSWAKDLGDMCNDHYYKKRRRRKNIIPNAR